MERRFDLDSLKSALDLRRRVLVALRPKSIQDAAKRSADLQTLAKEYRELASRTRGLPEARMAYLMVGALRTCTLLSRWAAATLGARPDPGRHLAAAKAMAASLLEEVENGASFPATRQGLSEWLGTVTSIEDVGAVRKSFLALARIPFPVFYSSAHDPYAWASIRRKRRGMLQATGVATGRIEMPLVKLLFELDGLPFA